MPKKPVEIVITMDKKDIDKFEKKLASGAEEAVREVENVIGRLLVAPRKVRGSMKSTMRRQTVGVLPLAVHAGLKSKSFWKTIDEDRSTVDGGPRTDKLLSEFSFKLNSKDPETEYDIRKAIEKDPKFIEKSLDLIKVDLKLNFSDVFKAAVQNVEGRE